MNAAPASIRDYVTAETITLDLSATTRNEAITELIGLAAAAGGISDRDLLEADVQAREAQGSTGMGDGIAIPHGKSKGVTRSTVAFARSAAGVDWGSHDGKPATTIFLIAVPAANVGNEHLQILARLARALVRAKFRDQLGQAQSVDEVLAVLDTI